MQLIKQITKKASRPIDLTMVKSVGYYPLSDPNKSNLPQMIPAGMVRVVVEDGRVSYIREEDYNGSTGLRS